ncbi:MAG TPA: hypothetical protein VFQ61_23495 [Polyangiaceae bacterium]|nr:hypothetical protein [Polyangiaceae bacterium]
MIPTPPPVEDLVCVALDYVERATGIRLDFHEETLPVLDHYAATVRAEGERNPGLISLIAPALGAYFGELVRSTFGGFWRVPTPNQHDWAVCLETTFLAFNPIGVAFDSVAGGNDHEGPRSALRIAPEDREYLEQRLEAIPPVPEEEYFLFSTRFEVLQVAVEALRAKMEEEGYGGTEYSADDYTLDYGSGA